MLSFLNMKFDKELLWFGLKGCLYCGSLFPHSDGLCDSCSKNLWQGTFPDELYHQETSNLSVHSLFEWVPGLQEVLSHLVWALKGTEGKELWLSYAEEFWRRYLISVPEKQPRKMLFIPSPSKSGEVDHAVLFAEALSAFSASSVCRCLRRSDSCSQKKKTRAQRLRIQMEWAENYTWTRFKEGSAECRIVFVDDVLTTGATARAAWNALGKPRDFAVWTLAQRGLSCGASKELI